MLCPPISTCKGDFDWELADLEKYGRPLKTRLDDVMSAKKMLIVKDLVQT
jgi:hypothetical protein